MIVVSDRFKNILLNLNKSNQTKEMSKLSVNELYLLLFFCMDSYKEIHDITVRDNLNHFVYEMTEVRHFCYNNKTTNNKTILELIELTNDNSVSTEKLVDSNYHYLTEIIP